MRCLSSGEITRQTVQQALEMGVNHLETARAYGQSEHYLGLALQSNLSNGQKRFSLTTKVAPTPDADRMARCLDQSLEQLGVDHIDCLAIHGINTWEHLAWVQAADGCMQAVQQALIDGRVRHLGFSTHGSLELILAAIATDLFEFVNLHYTLFHRRNAPALELAAQKDMGVLIISPADKGGLLYTPPPTLVELCSPFTPLHLNYRFLLSDPRITTLSVGAANPTELVLPLAVADQTGPLTSQELEVLECLEQQQIDALGGDRPGISKSERCSQCYACLPCPEAINIPEILRLRNLAVAYDMEAFGRYRYAMFENAGHWFPGARASRCTECGDCLPRCPEGLEIPTLLQDTHQRLKGPDRRRLWETN